MNRVSMATRHFILWSCALIFVVSALVTRPAVAQDELIDSIIEFLSNEDKEFRSLAYEQIRTELKGEAATKKFAAQLPKLSGDAQIGLLSALADRGDKAAASAVIELIEKTDASPVRIAAIQALGRLGNPEDHKLLVTTLIEGTDDEKTAARDALVKLGGSVVSEAMAKGLDSSPTEVQIAVLEILTTRRALNTIPKMLEVAATNNDAAIRGAAMKALSQLARPEDIGEMLQGVLRAERGRERIDAEIAVATVCKRIDEVDKRAESVIVARKKLDRQQQLALLSLLGRIGGAPALRAVEAAVNHTTPGIRELGLLAICNWPDASIEGRLLELARIEKDARHRRMALRALIRVATMPDDRTDSHRLDVLVTAFVMTQNDDDRKFVLQRVHGIRTIDALRFAKPFLHDPKFAEQACLTIVELAHHRKLREPNKKEFDKVLDEVIKTTNDEVVKDRAQRYKKDQTWVRPGTDPGHESSTTNVTPSPK